MMTWSDRQRDQLFGEDLRLLIAEISDSSGELTSPRFELEALELKFVHHGDGSPDLIFCGASQLDEARRTWPEAIFVAWRRDEEDGWPEGADEILSPDASYRSRLDLWRRVHREYRLRLMDDQLSASQRRVTALEVCSKALSELHDEEDVYTRLVEVVAEQLHSGRVSILRVVKERNELEMIAAHGISREIMLCARPKIGEGISGRCAESGEPIFIANHKQYRDEGRGRVSGDQTLLREKDLPMSLTLPILVKGEVVGVVNVTDRMGDRPYRVEEIAFLSALMSHAGYLMESTRLIDNLSSLQTFNEQVIQTLSDPLLVIDQTGQILKINQRCRTIFGQLESVGEALADDQLEEVMKHLQSGQAVHIPNIRYASFVFDLQLTPFAGDDPRSLLMFHDMTERHQIGKQLLSAEKMASLGILSAGIAHEINNPLGFVKTNVKEAGRYFDDLFELLAAWEQSQTGVQPVHVQEVTEVIGLEEVRSDIPHLVRETLEGVERIQKITASLKSFAHPDSENAREAQLSKLVDNAMVITQSKWKHTLTITRDLPEHGILSCIPSQLEQVFMNLIVNAAQAASSKGETSSMHITLAEEPTPEQRTVTILFSDRCGGIPAEVVERIFDPFFTTKDIGEGTGLGLHIAHNVIEGHGGEIKVESNPPIGTTFHITLPLGVKHGPMVIKQLSRFKV